MDLGDPLDLLRGEEPVRSRAVQIGFVQQLLAEQRVGKMRLINGDGVCCPDRAAHKDQSTENGR